MEVKDVDTNQSLNTENTIQQNLISYGQDISQIEVLTLALAKFDHQEENFQENVICYRQQLQQTLEKIDKSKLYIYESHNVAQKIKECTDIYKSSKEKLPFQNIEQNTIKTHKLFIENAEEKVDTMISKITAWRNKRILINKIKARTLRINGLIKKKYNMKNYIQQMQLVSGLITRVGDRLNSGDFDHRFLQQLMSKQLIPYNFYHNYCYNIIFQIISTRIKENSLIVFKQNEQLPELFNHMKNFFSRDIYENCQQFIRLKKHIRIINQQNLCIDDGFSHLFRPFFVRILEENDEIQPTTFLKARSLMQCDDFTIDIWIQYEDLLLEKYILWNYEQHNNLRKSQLIHLVQLKQSITYFKRNYQWINLINLKSNKIHGSNDFPYDFLKASLLKIFKPIMSQIYFSSFSEQKTKTYEKYKRQFQDYWFYCIFGKFGNLYNFIGSQLRNSLSSKNINNNSINFEEGELNIDQYYKYYQQMGEILSEQLENSTIGKEFKVLWRQCWLRILIQDKKIIQNQSKEQLDEELKQISHIKSLQFKLQQCITNKKAYKKDERADIIYGLLMNLNLNSCKYFLLKDGLKILDKQIQREINMIRDIVYRQLYG